MQKAFKFTGSWHPSLRYQAYVLDKKGIFNLAHKPGPLVENHPVMNIFCGQSCGKLAENPIKSLIRLKNLLLLRNRTNVGNQFCGAKKCPRRSARANLDSEELPRSFGGDLGSLLIPNSTPACTNCYSLVNRSSQRLSAGHRHAIRLSVKYDRSMNFTFRH